MGYLKFSDDHFPSNEYLIAKLRAEGSPLSLEAAKAIEELEEEAYAGWG